MSKPKNLPQDISDAQHDVLGPLTAIRTETVLSRLPVHNLSKRGNIKISIKRNNADGEISLIWEVSHNSGVGQPGQLAYKLDTLVINRKLDEIRTSVRQQLQEPDPITLPRRIKLGSISEIARDLGLAKGGTSQSSIRTALRQNAATFIRAKLAYKGVDGNERWLDAFFNRYNVLFTGERFPDGSTADAVYLILSDTYAEVLASVPYRPLDYEYLKELAPGPQRFYEVVSYRVYAAFENGYPTAKIAYSEYCTFSAQARYYDFDHVKKQMYKIHKPHLTSGYIRKISFESTIAEDGNPDWTMIYIPGPRAEAEYKAFTRKVPKRRYAVSTQKPPRNRTREMVESTFSDDLQQVVSLLEESGIQPSWAARYVAGLSTEQLESTRHVIDYWQAVKTGKNWRNPPGMLRTMLEIQSTEGLSIPESFPSASQRRDAETARQCEEDQINVEAVQFLSELRDHEAKIDARLSVIEIEEREVLRREAEDYCSTLRGFQAWPESEKTRRIDYEIRRLIGLQINP